LGSQYNRRKAEDGSGCECALCFQARDADLMVCGEKNARFLGGC
jgi:hypothetical protein